MYETLCEIKIILYEKLKIILRSRVLVKEDFSDHITWTNYMNEKKIFLNNVKKVTILPLDSSHDGEMIVDFL